MGSCHRQERGRAMCRPRTLTLVIVALAATLALSAGALDLGSGVGFTGALRARLGNGRHAYRPRG
ncbi:MAG: hypothetical protein MZV64_28670 [Ignavibacteriales bacterium]|nr:hypothetical protein [Ignavibacteriales bacterium]